MDSINRNQPEMNYRRRQDAYRCDGRQNARRLHRGQGRRLIRRRFWPLASPAATTFAPRPAAARNVSQRQRGRNRCRRQTCWACCSRRRRNLSPYSRANWILGSLLRGAKGNAATWASEGRAVAAKVAYAGVSAREAPKPSEEYLTAARLVIDEQLRRGAVRLAQVLNQALD